MKNKTIIANWKTNILSEEEAVSNSLKIESGLDGLAGVKSILCPSFVHLASVRSVLRNSSLGSQDISQFSSGAYTGEITGQQLIDLKTEFCLIGHSEVRSIKKEDDNTVNIKLSKAVQYQLTPILCLGAGLNPNDELSKIKSIIRKQYQTAVSGLDFKNLLIAYEPTWAISGQGGQTPDSKHLKNIYDFINQLVDDDQVENWQVLYGGNVNSNNIVQFMAMDGFLIGQASLDPDEYIKIAKIITKNEL